MYTHTHTDSTAEAEGPDLRAVDDDNDNRVKFNRRSKGSRCPQEAGRGKKQVPVATQGAQKTPTAMQCFFYPTQAEPIPRHAPVVRVLVAARTQTPSNIQYTCTFLI